MKRSVMSEFKRVTAVSRLALVAITALTVVATSPATWGDSAPVNPGILPPRSHPYGKTYSEWSAKHWKWTYSLPADHHPLTDTARVSTGQSGPVWFLGGTWASTTDLDGNVIGTADRHVTIPEGKALFFPIVDVESSEAEGNGSTEAELREGANYVADHAVDLECTIDGRPVSNLGAYRVESPLFEFGPLPEDNLLGLPEGTISPAVSDGYFIMLAPLCRGPHSIRFSGAFVFTAEEDGFDFTFTQDITYHITIR